MRYEVERKARVVDPDGLRAELRARFGEPKRSEKIDRYYIESGAALVDPEAVEGGAAGPRIFRLRRQGGLAIVTTKARSMRGGTEVNEEVEFIADDPDAFERFALRGLGFEVLVDKRKRTEAFDAPPLTLELSELEGLGWFLEVERLVDKEAEVDAAERDVADAVASFQPYLGDVEPTQYIVLLLRRAGRL